MVFTDGSGADGKAAGPLPIASSKSWKFPVRSYRQLNGTPGCIIVLLGLGDPVVLSLLLTLIEQWQGPSPVDFQFVHID